MLVRSFPPIVDSAAWLLVLGSMPGAASLAAGRYYAHPRNAFWPIMGELFGAGPDVDYSQRCRLLSMHGVAVWDVLRACRRPGSLDSSIDPATETPNDIAGLLERFQGIRLVLFNGRKAEACYRRHVAPGLDCWLAQRVTLALLPSTSPANAGATFAEKLAAWRRVLEA